MSKIQRVLNSQRKLTKRVLIVEDIIGTGNTLYRLKQLLEGRNPKEVKIVTLLDKPARRTSPLAPRLYGICH